MPSNDDIIEGEVVGERKIGGFLIRRVTPSLDEAGNVVDACTMCGDMAGEVEVSFSVLRLRFCQPCAASVYGIARLGSKLLKPKEK